MHFIEVCAFSHGVVTALVVIIKTGHVRPFWILKLCFTGFSFTLFKTLWVHYSRNFIPNDFVFFFMYISNNCRTPALDQNLHWIVEVPVCKLWLGTVTGLSGLWAPTACSSGKGLQLRTSEAGQGCGRGIWVQCNEISASAIQSVANVFCP